MATNTRGGFLFRAAGWRESVILVVVAWLVPFLVHLVPWTGARPLGVYLLPACWTTFIAVYFYGALPGVAVGLVTPLVSLALTGLPALRSLGLMSLELVSFAMIAAWLLARWPGLRLAAPLAWLAGKALTIGAQFLIPVFAYADNPARHWLRSTENALAGLGVLLAINVLLVAFYPKTDAWEKE